MAVPTGYMFYNILFQVFCIATASILLFKQFTVFNENDTQKAYTAVLIVQIIYFVSFIVRVLVDSEILPKTQLSMYVVNIVNFGVFAYCGYRAFCYLELYQQAKAYQNPRYRMLFRTPMLFNLALLLSSPITHVYFGVDAQGNVTSGSLWQLMVLINCAYPLAALVTSLWRYRGDLKSMPDIKVSIAFPLFFIVFGPLSSLQWRLPILSIGLILADLFVYIQYTDLAMRERNESLTRAKELAEQQNKAKSEFLSNMSHDIRTPMNAVIGFTNLALQNPDNPEQTGEYLLKIQASSNHLLSLINDVLEMSRIESGKIELEESAVSLPDILRDLNAIIVGQVEEKHHELFMDAVNVTDENIYCDKLRLNQVLLNLLSNSIKYTPDGGKISVRLIQKDGAPEGYGSYEIRVKDNGIGMTPEFAAKIFEAFEREKTSTVSGIQGTGLGMAITKRIIDLMDGTIRVETESGKGTEFIVNLTMRLAEEDKTPLRIAALEGYRTLVVDDDYDTCDSTTKMLGDLGLDADWTLSGKEAVLRAKQALERGGAYQLYLVDMRLGDMSGLDVARQLRESIGQEPPIMLISAYDWLSVKDEALEAGFTGFASKPLFKSALYDSLCRMIDAKPAEAEEDITEPAASQMSFAGKRLLLVDDIEINREIATMILEMNDFEVEEACDGDKAVDAVAKSDPGYFDAVLMDIQMPTMNGYDATRAIRALDNPELASIPIIAMTANAFDEDKQNAADAGMNGHVAKPIDVNQLISTLAQVL